MKKLLIASIIFIGSTFNSNIIADAKADREAYSTNQNNCQKDSSDLCSPDGQNGDSCIPCNSSDGRRGTCQNGTCKV